MRRRCLVSLITLFLTGVTSLAIYYLQSSKITVQVKTPKEKQSVEIEENVTVRKVKVNFPQSSIIFVSSLQLKTADKFMVIKTNKTMPREHVDSYESRLSNDFETFM